MEIKFFGHIIGAWKLAGHFDGLYYPFIDNMLDTEIKPSKYAKVVINRIKQEYASQFIFNK